MNKRGNDDAGAKIPYYITVGIGLVIIIAVFIAAVQYYVGGFLFLDEDVFHEMYAERVMTCFAVYDSDIERTLMIIDKAKIDDSRLDQCFAGSYKGVLAELEDVRTGKRLAIARNSADPTPDRSIPYPVLYKDGESIKRGLLRVGISRRSVQ